MKKILLLFLLFAGFFASAQTVVDPHTFPQETNPNNSNFEFYSRALGSNKRATFNNVRKNMSPGIVAVGFTPSLSGNTTNFGDFVLDPSDALWYIAYSGDAVQLPYNTPFSAGTGISISGGNVITNTGDLSNTNELQTISIAGQNLTLSNGGGTVTIPAGAIYTAGTGITILSNVVTNTGDLSATNEGLLSLSPGTDTTAIINSNTSGSPSLTILVRGGLSIDETGNTIILEGGAGDGVSSVTGTDGNGFDITVVNPTTAPEISIATTVTGITYGSLGELDAVTVGYGLDFTAPTLRVDTSEVASPYDLSLIDREFVSTSDGTSHTVTLTPGGGSFKLVEGANTTLTTSGTADNAIITIASTGGGGSGTVEDFIFTDGNGFNGTVSTSTTTPTLELETTVTGLIYGGSGDLLPVTIGSGLTFSAPALSAVDVSAINELQTISTGANTLTLSIGGGTVTVDTDPSSDLTTSTSFSGDVSGLYNNLQLGTGVVGAGELASTGVSAGSYTLASITVDSDGRITGASNGSEIDGSITNEGVIGVGSGGSNSATITSNTSTATGATIAGLSGILITESTSSNGGTVNVQADTSLLATIYDVSSSVPDLTEFQIAFGDSADKMTSDTALIWQSDSLRLGIDWTNPTAKLTIKGSPNAVTAGASTLFTGDIFCSGGTCYNLSPGTWFVNEDDECFSTTASSDTMYLVGFSPLTGLYDINTQIYGDPISIKVGSYVFTPTTGITTETGVDFTGVTQIIVFTTGAFSGQACLSSLSISQTVEQVVSSPVMQVINPGTGIPYPQFGLVITNKNLSFSNTLQNATGLKNIAIGDQALASLIDGDFNFAAGDSALTSMVSGNYNTAIGVNALQNNTGGASTAIGYNALRFSTGTGGNTAIGPFAGENITGSANTLIGQDAGRNAGSIASCIGVGLGALKYLTSGQGNTAIGNGSLSGIFGVDNFGGDNIALGTFAGYRLNNADRNILIGYSTGYNLSEGSDNIFFGSYAGEESLDGNGNIFFGNRAGQENTDGNNNIYLGTTAGQNCTTCSNNTIIGLEAGQSNTGSGNIIIGPGAGAANALNDAFYLNSGPSASPMIGGDLTNKKVSINRNISSLDSILATLDVGGTLRVQTLTATPTKVAGWSSGNIATDFILGGGLSISGDTLKVSAGGGGIYGGSGTVPSSVTATLTNTITFSGTDNSGGTVPVNINITGSEPEFLRATGNTGSATLAEGDAEYFLKSTEKLGLVSGEIVYLQGDSVQIQTVQDVTAFAKVLGQTSGDVVKSIDGTATGQALTWNGSGWAAGVASISPSDITVNQNDYNPTGLSSSGIAYISSTDIFYITGLQGGAANRVVTLVNDGDYPIIFPPEYAGSTAGNRFSGKSDAILYPGRSIEFIYDGTASRWRVKQYSGDAEYSYPKISFMSLRPGSISQNDWGSITWGGDFPGVAVNASSTLPFAAVNETTSTASSGSSYLYYGKSGVSGYIASTYRKSNSVTSIANLSDASNSYNINVGEFAGTPGNASNNSAFFRYNHSTNSGKWQCVTRDNSGTENTFDSGVTVAANTIYNLEVIATKGGTEYRFFINGSYAGSSASNLPATTSGMKFGVSITKAGGSTERTVSWCGGSTLILN